MLKQVNQITGVNAFNNFSVVYTNRAIVFNPNLPAFVFDYNLGNPGQIQVGLVIGKTQQQLYVGATGGSNVTANLVPTIFSNKSVITGGNVCGYGSCLENGSDECGPWFISYNLNENTYKQNCSAEPNNGITTAFLDAVIDYVNQYLYLYHSSPYVGSGVLFAVPFSQLQSFLANLQPPNSYKIAWIYPANNVPGGWNIYPGNLVLYKNKFYIVGEDSSGNYYIWVVPYSQIKWDSSYPSSPQNVGALYQIYTGGSASIGSIFLNYYLKNGSITPEILAYIPSSFNQNNITYNNVYVYSIDPLTMNTTQLYTLQNANAFMRAINIGGVIMFIRKMSSNSYVISAYDRKSNIYEQSEELTDLLGLLLAKPNYAIAFSGSPNDMTITLYEIMLDVMPKFNNVVYQNGVLSGELINSTYNVLMANAPVYLFTLESQGDGYSSGELVTSMTTDDNGNFSFNIPNKGYYDIKVLLQSEASTL